jgi:hypothetical protein
MTEYIKDPDATLNYTFDWADWLETGETITTAVFTVEAGLTKGAESSDATTATVTLSGGTVGGGAGDADAGIDSGYRVTCRITTNGGQIDDRSIFVDVAER